MKAEEISKLLDDKLSAFRTELKAERDAEFAAATKANETALAAKVTETATLKASLQTEIMTALKSELENVAKETIKLHAKSLGIPTSLVPVPAVAASGGDNAPDLTKFENCVAHEMKLGNGKSKAQIISFCVGKYAKEHKEYLTRSTRDNPIHL